MNWKRRKRKEEAGGKRDKRKGKITIKGRVEGEKALRETLEIGWKGIREIVKVARKAKT